MAAVIMGLVPVQPNREIRNNKEAVRFEVFTAVAMKNGVFWDVAPYGCCKNRRFGGTYNSHTAQHPRRLYSSIKKMTQLYARPEGNGEEFSGRLIVPQT
jgi:hypothetical protein